MVDQRLQERRGCHGADFLLVPGAFVREDGLVQRKQRLAHVGEKLRSLLIVHDERPLRVGKVNNRQSPPPAKSRTAYARIAKRRSLPTIHKRDAVRIDVCFFVRIERCYAFDAVAGVLEYRSMPRQSGVRRYRCSQRNVQKFPDMRDEHTATWLDYYTSHQASTQWRAFLTALAQEF